MTRAREAGLVALAYAAILAIGVSAHEYWRDEAHSWLLVGTGPSLGELVVQSWSTGHPPGWYLLLYAARQLGASPLIQTLLNGVIATTAVYLLVRFSPFDRAQRWLFPLGFFPLFQYGVVARSYAAVVLLLFLYCVARPQRIARPWRTVAPLVALPWFHVFGAFAAVHAVLDGIESWRRAGQRRGRVMAALAAVLLSGALVAVLISLVPRDGLANSQVQPHLVGRVLSTAFLPTLGGPESRLIRWGGLALFLMSWTLFIGRIEAALRYGVPVAALGAFVLTIYAGGPWHYGLFFVFFVVALWIAWQERPPATRWRSHLFTGLLVVQAIAGVIALAGDLRGPFSGSNAAAELVRRHDVGQLPIVGVRWLLNGQGESRYRFTVDELQSTTLYLAGKPIYDPIDRTFDVYWQHYTRANHFRPARPEEEIARDLDEVSRQLGSDLLVIVVRPDGADEARLGAPAVKLADLPSPIVPYSEALSVYRWPRR